MRKPWKPKLRQRSGLALSLSFLALASGCGGGDDGIASLFGLSPGGGGGSGPFGAYFMAALTDEWRQAAASLRENAARYRVQDGTFSVNGSRVFANPLHSSRVDYAHAVGLTGEGQVIAIVDSGFRRTHEALANKSTSVTGNPATDDHGTMVASIAAGNSASMVGVAPNADLSLGSFATYATLTAAANDARRRGAVAQNNSWGFVGTPVGQASFDSVFGNTAGAAWLSALEAYAQNGVVVFSVANDSQAITAGLMEALPALRPALESAWIAVGNAIPVFDDSGVSAAARRDSARCLEAARWCLVADGYWVAATASSNSSYGAGTGSSFAAPQVAGALALLAEAFPGLTPHQLRARLLASADNTFAGFVQAGTVDLLDGPGVFEHAYSTDFGHGFLDIRAALLPIGTTTLATVNGGTVATQDFGFATGGALGDAVAQSLAGIDLAVQDDFGGGFDVAAKSFATPARPEPLAVSVATRIFGRDLREARTAAAPVPLARSFAGHAGQTLELAAADGRTRAAVLVGSGESHGLALSHRLTDGSLGLDLGLKVAQDDGMLMGFSDGAGGRGAEMAAVTFGLSHDTGIGGFFALSAEIGVAELAAPAALSSVSSARFDSVSLDLGSRSVLARGDRLTLGVSMPLAVTSGSARMMAPVALGEGRTEMRSIGLDLAPSARQVDLSIGYQMPVGRTAEMLFEVVHAENHGNRAGFSDSAAVIGVKWSF